MVVLRHRHTAMGAEGRAIVLYFPFRQTSPIGPFGRNGQHSCSNADTAWIPDCHHPKKGVDRRQSYVARLCLIVSLALQVIQKTQDRRGIQIECMERRWLFVCCPPQKLQEEPVILGNGSCRSYSAIRAVWR